MSIDTPHLEGEPVRHVGGEGASVPHVLTRKRRTDHRMLRNLIYNYENDKPSRFIPYLKKVQSVLYLLSTKAHGDVSDLKSLSFVSPRNSRNQKQFSLITYRFPR